MTTEQATQAAQQAALGPRARVAAGVTTTAWLASAACFAAAIVVAMEKSAQTA